MTKAPKAKSVYDLIIDVEVANGDLVIYHNWASIAHGAQLGMVIGTDDDGKVLVMWCNRRSAVSFHMHEKNALRVLAQGKVGELDPDIVMKERDRRALRFFVSK